MSLASPRKRASRRCHAARHVRDAVDEDADAEKRDAHTEERRRTVSFVPD
jgi:hypothetical protein